MGIVSQVYVDIDLVEFLARENSGGNTKLTVTPRPDNRGNAATKSTHRYLRKRNASFFYFFTLFKYQEHHHRVESAPFGIDDNRSIKKA